MNMCINSKQILFGLCFVVAGSVAADPAIAAERGAQARGQAGANAGAPKHRGYTQTTQKQRIENGRTRSDVITTDAGKAYRRDATTQRDAAAGSRERDVTYTGPEGNTRTVEDTRQKTEQGHTRSTVTTDAQGRTATREAIVVKDAQAGTRQRDVTYTNRDGSVRTVYDDLARTDTGYERTTVSTGPDGGETTRHVDAVNDPGTQTTVKTVTVDRTPAP